MTTFLSREAVRDTLVTLFTSNGTWQAVYGYFPPVRTISGTSPILIIRGRGTSQEFANLNTNPTSYRIMLTSMVAASSPSDSSVTSQDAEDILDNLDKVVRQVIRDNVSNANWDNIEFEEGMSQVDDVIIEGGFSYIIESRAVLVHLANGAI